jgi:hypothetical protein
MTQTPKLGARIMPYELADHESDAIKPMLAFPEVFVAAATSEPHLILLGQLLSSSEYVPARRFGHVGDM